MEACQTDRGTLSLLSERGTFDHGSVRLRLIVRLSVRLRLRVRLRRVHKASLPDYFGNIVSKFHVDWTQGQIASQKTCTE